MSAPGRCICKLFLLICLDCLQYKLGTLGYDEFCFQAGLRLTVPLYQRRKYAVRHDFEEARS